MNSTLKVANRVMEQESQTLTYWPTLSQDEQSFVAAYVENGYSLVDASSAIAVPKHVCHKYLQSPAVKKAITEVQEAVGDIDFLNEKWVKAQLLRLFPMVMGDEEVPLIDSTGMQVHARKFVPEVALKVLEYVAPKKQPTVQIDIHNQIDLRLAVEEGNRRRATLLQSDLEITDVTPE